MNSKTRTGIVSDVANNAQVEHAKLVHTWAETHPQWKRERVADKPKIKNKCGECAAFRSTFCTWNTCDGPGVKADDDACGNYFARPRIETPTEKQFLRKVEQLE